MAIPKIFLGTHTLTPPPLGHLSSHRLEEKNVIRITKNKSSDLTPNWGISYCAQNSA